MLSQFKGLVLSETPWGENDRLLTVLTAESGKISILLKGGASLKNKASGACQPMCYSEFVTADRGGRPWVREATQIEGFLHIRESLDDTALALYICDVANEVCVENGDEAEMLNLVLNTLYAIGKKLKPRNIIKAAYEMRTAAVCGFSPDLVKCEECGSDNAEVMYLDVMDGVIHCDRCKAKHNMRAANDGHTMLIMPLEKGMLDAMRYVCYSNARRYLSFDIAEEQKILFSEYCEKYLLNHLDRGFSSLDFYKSLENMK